MSKPLDLNDARVQALKVATDNGLSIALFNEIWRIIVPAAKASGIARSTPSNLSVEEFFAHQSGTIITKKELGQ